MQILRSICNFTHNRSQPPSPRANQQSFLSRYAYTVAIEDAFAGDGGAVVRGHQLLDYMYTSEVITQMVCVSV
jgi:hypothetical protein